MSHAAKIGEEMEKAETELNQGLPTCRLQIVETLPISVFSIKEDLAPNHLEMHEAWLQLFQSAQSKIEIVSYYWGLQKGRRGKAILKALMNAASRKAHCGILAKSIHKPF